MQYIFFLYFHIFIHSTCGFTMNYQQLTEACLSNVKTQITASRKDIFLVLIYGIVENPIIPVPKGNNNDEKHALQLFSLFLCVTRRRRRAK